MKPQDITIEKGITIPPKQIGEKRLAYALRQMKQGDSFVWENSKAVWRAASRAGVKITTRKIDGGGYRVWRVK